MQFNSLFKLKRFLETSQIKSIWCLRLQGRYTVLVCNDIVELELNAKGKCFIHYTTRNGKHVNALGKSSFSHIETVTSETNSAGNDGVRLWLDKKIMELNYGQVG
jgi:hypothetical protein